MSSDRYPGWDLPGVGASSMAQLGSPFSNGSQFMPYSISFIDRDGRRVQAYLSDDQLHMCYKEYYKRHPEVIEHDLMVDTSYRETERIEKRKEKEEIQFKQNLKLLL